MARRKIIGLSVPPELFEEYAELARKKNYTKSELFREMIREYKRTQEEQEFLQLQQEIALEFQKLGITTEDEVDAIAFEDR